MRDSASSPLNERADTVGMDEDMPLVRAARADRAAFAALYARYVDRVYAYVRSRTATMEDAADLTQQVFLRALNALPRYEERRVPFAAWLFRIARNAVIDAHRQRRVTVAWDLVPEALQPVADLDLEARALREEEVARLRALLRGLDPEARELLTLRFAVGLTSAEIAAVVGKSEAAAKKRLTRILRTLKEQYYDHAT